MKLKNIANVSSDSLGLVLSKSTPATAARNGRNSSNSPRYVDACRVEVTPNVITGLNTERSAQVVVRV